jgi:class 3 adenylate cyclase/tetratricopeptide (TPR) repeat protein
VAQRKVVTALFVDVVGSTSLAESHDPETLRNVLDRYFAEARTVVERHGGSVEKFIGDAVVALFGVPVAHEDDALRALRTADELRLGLARLNESFGRVGIHIDVRMGVNTGEVVVDDARADGFRASGDTMNVAARLEQSAAPGEILLGALTRELGGRAIDVEAVAPLEVKGKSQPLEAHRLLRVLHDVDPYPRDASGPLVGRRRELAALDDALREARGSRRCVARTVVGPPGVGKSRLVREFLSASADGARVLVGRCPSYGEGVTFLPLAEALAPVLGGVLDVAEVDRERAEVALGLRDGSISPGESFSALRAVLESLARSAPLVVVVDDVHWAEPLLLDFLEQLVAFSTGGALLLLCLTRPELLDTRPGWGAAHENAGVVVVAPLGDVDSSELVGHLLRSRGLEADELDRVLEAADGNPLFLEQLLALNAALGQDDPVVVPPTISALLAARLDQLEDDERRVLDAAAVEGRVFHRAHVERLVAGDGSPGVAPLLLGLEHRQFVRPAVGRRAGFEAFAFAHGLVRDAAYAAISKDRRARLHVALADVLTEDADALDEIVGLHLADAARLRSELGYADEETRSLALRAARLLLAAGERALGMGDDRAAAKLLERAAGLVGTDEAEGRLARLQLGRAFGGSGRLDEAGIALSEATAAARASGDRALELRGELALANLQSQTDVTISMGELRERAEGTLSELEELEDEPGLALAWWLLHWTHFRQGRYGRSIEAAEQAIVHAVRANERRDELRALGAIAIAARAGDLSVAEALETCDEVVRRADGARFVDALAARARGHLLARVGDFERGRAECMRAERILEELGLPISALGVTAERALVEQLAGELEEAETRLRRASERFRELGDIAYLSWINPMLATVLAERGSPADALALARAAREEMQPDHAFGQIVSRVAEGAALRLLGSGTDAQNAALEAYRLAEATDASDLQAQALLLLADLHADDADAEGAAERRSRALDLYERKGDVVLAARVRELL